MLCKQILLIILISFGSYFLEAHAFGTLIMSTEYLALSAKLFDPAPKNLYQESFEAIGSGHT